MTASNDSDEPRITDEMVERAAYPIFVGVARAPWTSREDDEPCPVEPFTKNHARNIARAALRAALPGSANA